MDSSLGTADPYNDLPKVEPIAEHIQGQSRTSSPNLPVENPSLSFPSKTPSQPLPTTESSEKAPMAATGPPRKKGTASTVKKAPKRANGGEAAKAKKVKTETTGPIFAESSEEDESEPDEFEQEEDIIEAEAFQTLRAEDEDWEIAERGALSPYSYTHMVLTERPAHKTSRSSITDYANMSRYALVLHKE